MTQLYMLDTNTVSYVLKRKSPAARARISGLLPGGAVCLSSITEGELRFGVDRIGGGGRLRTALQELLDGVRVLPWGSAEAAVYGRFRANQESIGRPLGPLDTQIAAHAIAVGAVLVTSDSAFNQGVGLPGLENWATDVVPKST